MKNKNFYKPLYKNFVRLNKNTQDRLKFLLFKKQKWKRLILNENKKNENKKIKLFDHSIYLKPKSGFDFIHKFKFYLHVKQNLRFFYGKLSVKIFNQFYNKFNKAKNKFYFNILFFLEKRLDVVLYRTLFFYSIRNSQQFINHGKIYVNGKKVTINSYLIKKGDLIEIHFTSHSILLKNYYKIVKKNKLLIPKYFEINYRTFQFYIVSDINFNKISYSFPFWLNLNRLFLLNH